MSRIDTDWQPDSVEDELRSWAFSGNIKRAIAGKKGQKFLRELEAALLAMPAKRLVSGVLVHTKETPADGDVCALGSVAVARQMASGMTRTAAMEKVAKDFDGVNEENYSGWEIQQETAALLKICHPLAYAVIDRNDECSASTPEERYWKVLSWVQKKLAGQPECT